MVASYYQYKKKKYIAENVKEYSVLYDKVSDQVAHVFKKIFRIENLGGAQVNLFCSSFSTPSQQK